MVAFAVVRIRGTVGIKKDIRKTLESLMLKAPNNCIIIPDNEYYRGMLQNAKDYITWGEIDEPTLSKLILEKGEINGGGRPDEKYIRNIGFADVKEISNAIIKNDTTVKNLDGMKRVFRLSPPKKGYEGIKRSYANGGALGYRGKMINDLIRRML